MPDLFFLAASALWHGAVARLGKPLRNCIPIHIGHESLDIFRSLSGLKIHGVCMLPHIHHEDWFEARDMPHLMIADPMIGQDFRAGVLIQREVHVELSLAQAFQIKRPASRRICHGYSPLLVKRPGPYLLSSALAS